MVERRAKQESTFMLPSGRDCAVIKLLKERTSGEFGERAIEGHVASPAHAWRKCDAVAEDWAVRAAVRATPKAYAELISRRDGREAQLEW